MARQRKKTESTTAVGDAFRDTVFELLKAAGFAAQTETLEGHKRVDLFFEEQRFGKRRRYAVEAKNWKRPLDHSDLEKIYGGYASLIHKQAIHELIVVAPHSLTSPAAKAFVRDTSFVTHQSFNEFQESVLGFHRYLAAFSHRHERRGLEEYFVQPVLSDGTALEERIEAWLQADRANPIAVIAGYGMGKTSFAEHLTYQLAQRFLRGDPSRVPILVSLGAISREQSLEGLISTVLAGSAPSVQNYSFPVFSQLNVLGRFLIILDGFDEMKHMMTETDFRSNFDELNRLVGGNAKVLLLGRPTAFLSEQERANVLRGTRRVGSQWHRTPGAPQYDEVSLSVFSPDQIREFLTGYFRYRAAGADSAFIAKRQEELEAPEHEALISRPVHAKMLADLASDPDFEIKGLTRFALYEHFIDHLIDREALKPGRGALLKREDRKIFASELAWHLWTTSNGTSLGCRMEDLPGSLFAPYEIAGEDEQSVRRALLSGSFLDEKRGGVFFFAHRSFQEFLVAEYLWSHLGSGAATGDELLRDLSTALTDEVFDFLIERGDNEFLRSLLTSLNRYRHGVPLETFLILLRSQVLQDIASGHTAATMSSWDAGIMIAAATLDWEEDPDKLLHTAQLIAVRAARKPTVILAAIKTLFLVGSVLDLSPAALAPALIALLFARSQEDIIALGTEQTRPSRADPLRDSIFVSVSAELLANDTLELSLDLDELFQRASAATLHPIEPLAEDVLVSRTIYRAPFDTFFEPVNPKFHRRLYTFFLKDAQVGRALRRPIYTIGSD